MVNHRISRAALSRRSGFDPSHVTRWLNGKVTPSLKTMVTLDQALTELIEEKNDA